jgi:hypothetical protein
MRVILHSWCQIQRTSSSLRQVNCGTGHIQNIYSYAYFWAPIFSCRYLHSYCRYLDNTTRVILQIWCQVQSTSSGLRYVNCGPGHIQCNCSSAYAGFNIRLNVSALRLENSRQFNARYIDKLVPNTAHILRFTLCELWPRTYTMYLLLRIFRLQYSTERICASIGDKPTFRCALRCKLGAKYGAHQPI